MAEASRSLARGSFVLAAALLLAALGIGALVRPSAPPAARSLAGFPLQVGDWGGQVLPLAPATLAALDLHDYLNRVYFGPHQQVAGLYIAYYPRQTFGDDIHSPKHCLPGTGWVPVQTGTVSIRMPEGEIQVNRYLVARGRQRELILYWYQQQGRVISSEYRSKLFQVWDGLRQHRSDAALVRVAISAASGDARASAEGEAFVRLIFPHLSAFIPN
ncbi:MAG: exosortase C-terminal domain/associated protein EpsI [Terriglobales bacterium]